MKLRDNLGKIIQIGDIIYQIIGDDNLPKGSEWKVVEFGIEPSTQKQVCLIKDLTKGYIMAAYPSELYFFRKKVVN